MVGGAVSGRATFFASSIRISVVPEERRFGSLYLDSATSSVRRDIGELWDQPLDGAHAWPYRTSGAYIDAARASRHSTSFKVARWPTPIPNFRELGCPGVRPMYFKPASS